MAASTFPDKMCPRCGRSFSWRKKWRSSWESVVYCSERCRRRKLCKIDQDLERTIIALLAQRTGTICPSEAARRLYSELGASSPESWRSLMEPTRAAARRLSARQEVEIRQKGRRVDPSTAKGAIRIARGSAFDGAEP